MHSDVLVINAVSKIRGEKESTLRFFFYLYFLYSNSMPFSHAGRPPLQPSQSSAQEVRRLIGGIGDL